MGLGESKELFTPSVPATPNFFAGGSEDRLVTIQTSRDPITIQKPTPDEEQLTAATVKPLDISKAPDELQPKAQPHDVIPNVVQVTRGNSVNDIGDVEEQQSLVEDVSELQTVVADGGRLTEISRSQAFNPSEHFESPSSNLVASSLGLSQESIHTAEDQDQNMLSATEPGRYAFPAPSNFDRLNRLADELPDFVHIPLHMAVKDETLDHWEEEWFAHAQYDAATHGKISEPKIDFVYTCEFEFSCAGLGS